MGKVSQIRNKVKGPIEARIPSEPVEGEEQLSINLTYYPSALTPAMEEKIHEMSGYPIAQAAELTREIVATWDLEDDYEVTKEVKNPNYDPDGPDDDKLNPKKVSKGTGVIETRVVPLTKPGLMNVPAEILFAVTNACTKAQQVPKTRPERSDSSFSKRDE